MLTDNLLTFQPGPPSAPLSLVLAAGGSLPSTNTYDTLGTGVGTAPVSFIGNRSTFGADMGVGERKIEIRVAVGTAFATENGCTLSVSFQVAPDTGAAGGYLPGTWQTCSSVDNIPVADLAAQQIIRITWPPSEPAFENARFQRLLFSTPAGESFTAGTIAFGVVTMTPDDYSIKYASKNYTA
jgi:hypothetical protein